MVPPAVLAELAALPILFAISVFFSMSETAMIGVSRLEVRRRAEEGDARAVLVDRMLEEPERVLSTVLVGNTIVNISAATLATAAAEQVFADYATLIATVFVTVVVLIACDLVPKTIAVQRPLVSALRLARPLRTVESILKPFIATASAVSGAVVRLFGVRPRSKAPYITSDEIQMMVRLGVEGGHVERFEQRVITELFDFTETPVRDLMTPADKVHFLPRNATLNDATRMAAREGRSRIVVVDGGFDRVVGFVHIKDLLHYTDQQLDAQPVATAVRTCLYAPDSTRADELLTRMQREHRSLAIIQDAAQENVGLVTVDDLVEELVGEIHDEFDTARTGHAARHARPRPGPGAAAGTGVGGAPGEAPRT